MEQLYAQQWKEKLDASSDGIIIDVRTPEEWEGGIIPNAVLKNIHEQQEFTDFVQYLDKDKEYFMYCKSGARSGNACAYMQSIGFTKTYNLAGGYVNWPYKSK